MEYKTYLERLPNIAVPVGRVFIAMIFVLSGFNKIGSYEYVATWMNSMGVPGALLPVVIALEVLGGMAIILGFKVRLAAFLLSGFCVVSALIFHSNFADQNEMISFLKNIAVAGGFLFLVANGAGKFALDNQKKSE
jgi:putative oxidoreductase